MIIRFTDDYIDEIKAAQVALGNIHSYIAEQEPFVGLSRSLDNLYARSVLLSGIIDHLSYDDNSDPKSNETILLNLKKIVNMDVCKTQRNKVKNVKNNHITS